MVLCDAGNFISKKHKNPWPVMPILGRTFWLGTQHGSKRNENAVC